MAWSRDPRTPTRWMRGSKRYNDVGGHSPPGDELENTRDHERIWFELKRHRHCCCDPADPGFRYCVGEKKSYPTMICAEEFLTGATLLDYFEGGGNNDGVASSWYLDGTCGVNEKMYSEPFGTATFFTDGSWRNGPFVTGMGKPGLTQSLNPWWLGDAWVNVAHSFEFWIKPSATDIAQGKQLTAAGPFMGLSSGGYFTYLGSDGSISFAHKDVAGGVAQVSGAGKFVADGWHHVVFVRKTANGGSFSIYINGTRVLNSPLVYPVLGVDTVSCQFSWGTGATNSQWADLARYSGAISGSSIWRHYRAMADDYGLTPPTGDDPGSGSDGGGGVSDPGDYIFDLSPDRIDGEDKVGYVMMSDGDTGYWESQEGSPFELEERKGQADGYASLDAGGLVPEDQLGSGGGDTTKFLRGDRAWRTGTIVPPPEVFGQILIAGAGPSGDYVTALLALSPRRYYKLTESGNPPASVVDTIAGSTGTPVSDPQSVSTDPCFYGESAIEFDSTDGITFSQGELMAGGTLNDFSFAFLLWIDALPVSTVRIVEDGAFTGNGVGFKLRSDGKLEFFAESRWTQVSNTVLTTGRWYHIVGTVDGDIFAGVGHYRTTYIDGVQDIREDNSLPPFDVFDGGAIANDGFQGRVAHLACWQSKLSDTAAATLYAARIVDWVPYTGPLGGVEVDKNDVDVTAAARGRLNFVEGAGIVLTVTDDAANGEVDITIAASGGGGGVEVDLNDVDATAAARGRLNFIEGAGIDLTIADDAANGEVDITIATTGGGDVYAGREPDRPPTSPHAKDDEFGGTSLDVKWSWFNQSTRTATVSDGGLVIACGASPSNTGGVVQAAPTGDFTASCKLDLNGAIHGLIVGTTSGGKIVFGYDAMSYRIWRLNSSGVWSSTIIDGLLWANPYIRVQKVGTTLKFLMSSNGRTWRDIGNSQTIGGGQHLTSLDEVGLCAGNTVNEQVSFEWFRVTE